MHVYVSGGWIFTARRCDTQLDGQHGWLEANNIDDEDQVLYHVLDALAAAREWLRDVEAHLDTITSDLRRLSGDLSGLTETFFNANANRLNRLVSLVAVGSMFFLIWTLVTGFFGQNFGYLVDSIDSKRDFVLFEAGALLLPTVILAAVLWWRRRDWW